MRRDKVMNVTTKRKPCIHSEWWVLCTLWLGLLFVFFAPIFVSDKVLAPLDILDSLLRPWADGKKITTHNAFTYDAITQYLPYNWSVYQSLQQDGYIGWNPYTHGGHAILENTMLCPGDWHHQLYRIMPFWDAWNVGIVVQFFVAGLGMLLLLRQAGIPPHYTFLGVVSYGLYSQFITWYAHRWVLGSMCWAPWMLWAFERACLKKRRVDLPSIIFTALAFRGGHLQSSLFVVIITALFFFEKLYVFRKKRDDFVNVVANLSTVATFSTILSLDVWLNTIPAYLQGCSSRSYIGWLDAIKTAPIWGGAIYPLLLGTPQSLNLPLLFGSNLFDIPFLGTVAFMLGMTGAFRKEAPRAARLMMIAGLLLPVTPAQSWLYYRCTPIFALGCAWLASWHIWRLASEKKQAKLWRTTIIVFVLIVCIWFAGSIGTTVFRDRLEPFLQKEVVERLPVNKQSRNDWMVVRTTNFIDRSMIWSQYNIVAMLLIVMGLLAGSRINSNNRNASLWAVVIAFSTFGELYLYSRTWLTFSQRPTVLETLYDEPDWIGVIRQNTGNGSVVVSNGGDFDYMQLNALSVHNIRQQAGYDTVVPIQCKPLEREAYVPEDYAKAGVSCLLVRPDLVPEKAINNGWQLVHDSCDFKLYSNPAFTSRIVATLADGTRIPISIDSETFNTRVMMLPVNTVQLDIAESFNKKWRAVLQGHVTSVNKSERNGMTIALPKPVATNVLVELTFVP